MFLASAPVVTLRCPGEAYDIPLAVHRARLAAGYAKCRHCPHHPAAVGLPVPECAAGGPPGETGESAIAPAVAALFQPEGIRGVYLNQLDRQLAGELAAAFAQVLARELPEIPLDEGVGLEAPAELPAEGGEGVRVLQAGVRGPTVVLAQDERPSSPDLARGVCLALRRMGFQVVDLGIATRGEMGWAIGHLQGVGGVLVTGAGKGPEWTGLDLAGPGGEPWSQSGRLADVLRTWQSGVVRGARRSGGLRSSRLRGEYLAHYQPWCHALRPLRMAWSCAARLPTRLLRQLLQTTACQLFEVETAVRSRPLDGLGERDLQPLVDCVLRERAHLGLWVDELGQQVWLVDERGMLVPSDRHARWLRGSELGTGQTAGAVPRWASREAAWRALRQTEVGQVEGPAGFHGFSTPFAGCDAVGTIVRTLQALSQSDRAVSDWIAQCHRTSLPDVCSRENMANDR
jgi:hypothetical protein